MRTTSLILRLLSVLIAVLAVFESASAQSPVHASGTVKLVRTGWNADSFAVVLSTQVQNPANCPTPDGYASDSTQLGYETYLDAALAAYQTGAVVTAVIASSGCVQGRPKLIGIDQLPLAQPESRTVVLRVNSWVETTSTRRFSDQPIIGTFNGHGTDCSHGVDAPPTGSQPAGAGVFGDAGWGEVEISGNDSCTSWVTRFGFDFDLVPFTSIPGVTQLQRVVLRYAEKEAPACSALVFTQGGFLFDALRCWTNGAGNPENKPNGCLFLRVPSVDWRAQPKNGPFPLLNNTFPKIGPGRWDVTDLFRRRVTPGLEPPPQLGGPSPKGWGFALVGAFTDTNQLDARDNTRCTSRVSDIALEVSLLILPAPPPGDPVVVH